MNSLVQKISVVFVKSLDIFGTTLFLIYILHRSVELTTFNGPQFLYKLLARGICFVVSHKKSNVQVLLSCT